MAKSGGLVRNRRQVTDSRAGAPSTGLQLHPDSSAVHLAREQSRPARSRDGRVCCECQTIIPPHTRYWPFRVHFQGKWYKFDSCMACGQVREDYFISQGRPFTLTGLWQDMEELLYDVNDPSLDWLR